MTRASDAGTPGQVRIIAGSLRGSVLQVPARPGLRPTPNRLRETLFNWLAAHVPGACCLDLFAGSGALGIEALSRGAAQVDFVERDAGLAAALRANLERLHCADRGRVHAGDALAFLAQPVARPFNLVLADPPFADGLWDAVVARLGAEGGLAPSAHVYLEMPSGTGVTVPATWSLTRETRAGEVRGALYRTP
ncbi:MAG TPA: 16S rRNA (guanine(966)-N(2))-methyltransferase RsmD [Rhodanobacteraceae bacterium]